MRIVTLIENLVYKQGLVAEYGLALYQTCLLVFVGSLNGSGNDNVEICPKCRSMEVYPANN